MASRSEGQSTSRAYEDVIAAYDAAWGTSEPDVRRRLIERSVAEDGELIEPRGRFVGREAILERLAGFSSRFPGARVEVTSGLDAHNGFVRYGWTIVSSEGASLLDGIDVAELGADGRLRRVVMFFGPLPPRAPA
jgi:hypothetical protein